MYAAQAAALARHCDVAIVMPIRPECEGFDAPDLSLPWGQDALIDAVAAANPNTVVVLQTGNPVAMPWRDRVKAIVAAWFPGEAGGQAIAEILAGTVNPSGRLPLTFPAAIGQTPRPEAPGLGVPWGTSLTVNYQEGADVGYRWFAKQDERPLYAFGHGLSYTTFSHGEVSVAAGEELSVSATVTNAGDRAGADVLQFYLIEAAGEAHARLIAFERVELEPAESRRVTARVDPRLLARFDGRLKRWRIAQGTYKIALGCSATDFAAIAETTLPQRSFGV
jgi:beta-glucosidase